MQKMAEEQELKHVCKFCSKSFNCGRSLGGHMRSHMINDITALADGTKLTKKKLPPLADSSYVLRENPKKTWRISGSNLLQKCCRECGKEFQSWKALFGHMKCHSIEEQESWDSVEYSQSEDNEIATNPAVSNPNRRKRSQRKTRQIVVTTANSSSSLCFANNNDSPSVSEIEQEQEEVAISLMMLSRNVGGFNSVAESSDNNSVFLEKTKKSKVESRKTEHSVSGISRKMKSQLDAESVVENYETELGKRKFSDEMEKNSRFECTTCNKTFHSYQALGGHRASHKKNKGCNGSKTETSENSIETVQLSPNLDETKLIKSENSVDLETKKSRSHVCPICLKAFPTGQALGGHKRSHLAATMEAKIGQNSAVEEQNPPPIRDFLDLNLPAPSEEDSNGVSGLNQWWIESANKHGSFLGLISN